MIHVLCDRPLAARRSVRVEDLADVPPLLFREGLFQRALLEDAFAARGLIPQVTFRVEPRGAARGCAGAPDRRHDGARLDRIQALARELSERGGKAAALRTDVTDHEQVKKLVDLAVESYGRIDVILNNAGLMPHSPLERLKIDDWDRTIDVNIKGSPLRSDETVNLTRRGFMVSTALAAA